MDPSLFHVGWERTARSRRPWTVTCIALGVSLVAVLIAAQPLEVDPRKVAEVEALVRRAEYTVHLALEYVKIAPRGKATAADLGAMQGDLEGAKLTIEEAHRALVAGDVLEAEAKTQAALNTAEYVMTAIEVVVASYGGGGSIGIPVFPLRPPAPSTKTDLDPVVLRKGVANTQLREIAGRLRQAIVSAGYADLGFFLVPGGGIALVTRMEQFDPATGSPRLGEDRWARNVGPPRMESVSDFFRGVFRANPGHFRALAFVVHPGSVEPEKLRRPSKEHVADWQEEGPSVLPSLLGRQPFDDTFRCTVLVYEFEQKSSSENATAVEKPRFSAREHLERTGIWAALEK